MAKAIERATRKQFPEGIPAYGTDALRFTFCSLATQGRDIRFDLGRVAGYRNFCNKLWNAARYVLMNTEGQDCGQAGGDLALGPAERWIRSRLARAISEVRAGIDGYRFDQAAQAIYEFTWSEYCDWYLELSKPGLAAGGSEAERRGTRFTLVQVLETLLRLTHPLMPFLTEEIWQRVAPLAGVTGDTIMLRPFPEADASLLDEAAEAEMGWVMAVVLGVRRIRGEMNIAPGKLLPLLLQNGSDQDRAYLERHRVFVETLARLESITWLEPTDPAPESAVALVGELKLLIPMAGLIDKTAELARLGKEIERLRKDLERSEAKLASPTFVERAPADVVEKERTRVAELQAALAKLAEQRGRIAAI
jgi:valyl-tRNA synthetase